MTGQFVIALVLFAAGIVGFSGWFWQARGLTGDASRDAPLKRRLRFIMLGSFLLMGAALLAPSLLRYNVR